MRRIRAANLTIFKRSSVLRNSIFSRLSIPLFFGARHSATLNRISFDQDLAEGCSKNGEACLKGQNAVQNFSSDSNEYVDVLNEHERESEVRDLGKREDGRLRRSHGRKNHRSKKNLAHLSNSSKHDDTVVQASLTSQLAKGHDTELSASTDEFHTQPFFLSAASVKRLLKKFSKLKPLKTHSLMEWTRIPSHFTMRKFERLFEEAIEKDSFELYNTLLQTFAERYDTIAATGRPQRADFVELYAVTLLNTAAFSMANLDMKKAIDLFRKCLVLGSELEELRRKEMSSIDDHLLFPPLEAERMLPFLHVRILLANALLADGRYWDAFGEYFSVEALIKQHHIYGQPMPQWTTGKERRASFSRDFVQEDISKILSNEKVVQKAIEQGQASLLLLASRGGNILEVMQSQLTMARLLRAGAKDFPKSQEAYERYLDMLVEENMDDAEGAMYELGLMLVFEMREWEVGKIYLEATAEMRSSDATEALAAWETFLASQPSSSSSSPSSAGEGSSSIPKAVMQKAYLAANAQMDLAAALDGSGKPGNSLVHMEKALNFLDRSGLTSLSAQAHMLHASILSSVCFVDKAISEYETALKILSSKRPPEQVGGMCTFVPVNRNQAELQLADCIQLCVGDYKRATFHYERVLKRMHRLSERRYTNVPVSYSALPSSEYHWCFTQYATCLRKMGKIHSFTCTLLLRVRLELALGMDPTDSYLEILSVLEENEKDASTFIPSIQMLAVPKDLMPPEIRIRFAYVVALKCYSIGAYQASAILLEMLGKVMGTHDPIVLADYARALTALSRMDPSSSNNSSPRGSSYSMNTKQIASIFKEAASLIVAHRVVDEAEGGDNGRKDDIKKALCGLIALSRGAFFFQYNGYMEDAEDMYKYALSYADTDSFQWHQGYARELGILMVNYATLLATAGKPEASDLYEKAAALCSKNEEVIAVVVQYFISVRNYPKAVSFIQTIAHCTTERTQSVFASLVSLADDCWPSLSIEQKLKVMDHLLLALGSSFDALPSKELSAPPSDEASLTSLVKGRYTTILLSAIQSSTNPFAANLACYLFQTRFSLPDTTNRLYIAAIKKFPSYPLLLASYAKLCSDYGYLTLARKYYAKAYGYSNGDASQSERYGFFLYSYYGTKQIPNGESLFRTLTERGPTVDIHYALYARFLSVALPSPFKTEELFAEAIRLGSSNSVNFRSYACFLWNLADTAPPYLDATISMQRKVKAEALFSKAVELSPNDCDTLRQFGTFYANSLYRFDDALRLLYSAHKIDSSNLDVVRQLCSLLHAECQRERENSSNNPLTTLLTAKPAAEKRQNISKNLEKSDANTVSVPSYVTALNAMPNRLRTLASSAKDFFDLAITLDPQHRNTIEEYAQFATSILQDTQLSISLWQMINSFDRNSS